MRSYLIVERPDGWWVQAHSWLEPVQGELVDINGPFEAKSLARAYIQEVQVRQVLATAAVMGRAA